MKSPNTLKDRVSLSTQQEFLSIARTLSANSPVKTANFNGWDKEKIVNGKMLKPPIPHGLVVVARYNSLTATSEKLARAMFDLLDEGVETTVSASAPPDDYENPFDRDILVEVKRLINDPESLVCVQAISLRM